MSLILDIKSAASLSGRDVASPPPAIEALPPAMVPKLKRAIHLSRMLDTLEEHLAAYRAATGDRPVRGATVDAGGSAPWTLLARQLFYPTKISPRSSP